MSDKADLPKKKATASLGASQDLDAAPPPSTTGRKRKAAASARTETHGEVSAARSRAAQGRRSDPITSVVSVAVPPSERLRQRPSQTLPAHRRMSMDVRRDRSRRPNMSSHAGARPGRTKRASSVPPGPPRTMLQHAWHTVLNSDPLVDSDEECPDEHLRLDYDRRIQVITRLRGKPPTPEPECS